MSGIQQWSKNVQVAANPSKRIVLRTLDFSTAIGVGLSQLVNVYAPQGYVSRIIGMFLRYPIIAASTSGFRQISVMAAGGGVSMMQGKSNFGTDLMFQDGWWKFSTSYTPNDMAAILATFNNLQFDSLSPLQLEFYNGESAADGGSAKVVRIFVVEEKTA